MSETIPHHEHLTIVSHARDITLHYGEAKLGENGEPDHVITEKTDVVASGGVWDVVLVSKEYHASNRYLLYLKNQETEDTHSYVYDVGADKFSYEFPIGNPLTMSQGIAADHMESWLKKCWNTPEAIDFDTDGVEWQRQVELVSMGAHLAVSEVLATEEGDRVFEKLLATEDPQLEAELYQEFYEISHKQEVSFAVGAVAMQAVLEQKVENTRLKK